MVRFGPSGNDILFYQQGFKSTIQAPAWVKALGLDAFEVSFGRGIRMSEKTAIEIGEQAKIHGIQFSAHAPYFINLASSDLAVVQKSYKYIESSLRLLMLMGGKRLVIHIGSQGELERAAAVENCKKNLRWVMSQLSKNGIMDYLLCIETMGRFKAIGSYQEICDICSIDERVIPTLDFGHINCTLQGELARKPELFGEIINYVEKKLGHEKMDKAHIHFSAIVFNENGERKHTVLADPKYTIPFEPLAWVIKQKNLNNTVICESEDIMAQDAVTLKKIFNSL